MIMKMLNFGKIVLDHEDFVSGMSLVSLNNNFENCLSILT